MDKRAWLPAQATLQQTLLPVVIVGCIAALAFVLRFSLAHEPGFGSDIGINQGWARSAVELGLATSYREQINGNMLPNYPPLGIMIFAATGHLYEMFISSDFEANPVAWRIAIKLPGILADVITCLLLYGVVRDWKGRKAGYIAALLFALNPAVSYNSAVWGQTDSIFTMFLVASLWAILRNHMVSGAALAVLAFMSKAQAVILFPLFLVLYTVSLRTFLSGAAAGLLASLPVLLPFIIGGSGLAVWNVYTNSVGYYTSLCSGSYNFWWGLFSDACGSKQDTDLLFGLLSYRTTALLMFVIAGFTPLFLLRTPLRLKKFTTLCTPAFFLAAAALSLAFFTFNAEMHERYLFPFTALALPIAFIAPKFFWLYIGVCMLFLGNLLGILPYTRFDRALYGEFPALDVFIGNALTFLYLLLFAGIMMFAKENRLTKKSGWKRIVRIFRILLNHSKKKTAS